MTKNIRVEFTGTISELMDWLQVTFMDQSISIEGSFITTEEPMLQALLQLYLSKTGRTMSGADIDKARISLNAAKVAVNRINATREIMKTGIGLGGSREFVETAMGELFPYQ